jgi:hypothetical protein
MLFQGGADGEIQIDISIRAGCESEIEYLLINE